jgi:uncharacterized delta-60 repeat protein
LPQNPSRLPKRFPAVWLLKHCRFLAVFGTFLATASVVSGQLWPRIDRHPASQVAFEGGEVRLTVQGSSDSLDGITYEWRKDGVPLAGQTRQNLLLRNAILSDAGLYEAAARNSFGKAWTDVARVEILCRAPSPGQLEPSFLGSAVSGDSVRAIVADADGRLLVGGEFTAWGSSRADHLVRLMPDGSVDTTFRIGVGANDQVLAIAMAEDRSIWVGGKFTEFGGQTCNRLVRLLEDGSIAPDFQAGSGPDNGEVRTLLAFGNTVFVGGTFDRAAGENSVGYFAKFQSDGTLDERFRPRFNATVNDLDWDQEGRIVAVGSFTTGGYNRIARLFTDGALDDSFFRGSGSSQPVDGVAIQPATGNIVICGRFFRVHGKSQGDLARLLPDGQFDESFDVDADNRVRHVAVDSAGSILVAGDFSTINGKACPFVARINEDGSLDSSFSPPALDDDGMTLLPATGRGVFVGGKFEVPKRYLVKLQGKASQVTAPRILCGPVDWSAVEGGHASFSVLAEGEEPIAFQWYREGEKIEGATKAVLSLTGISGMDAAEYSVAVSNPFGSKRSDPALLTVRALEPGEVRRHYFAGSTGIDASADVQVGGTPVIDDAILIEDPIEIGDVDLTINLSHPFTPFLSGELRFDPAGGGPSILVALFHNGGESGSNFVRTTFDDGSNRGIEDGRPPFNGSFRPATGGRLAAFSGGTANGRWRLRIRDLGEDGVKVRLDSWQLTLSEARKPIDYPTWANRFFPKGTPPPEPDADFDNDGVSNLVDFALVRRSQSLPVAFAIESSAGGSSLLTHRRWNHTADVVYRYEISNDLVNWNVAVLGADILVNFVTVRPNGEETVTLQTPISGQQQFLRLAIETQQ